MALGTRVRAGLGYPAGLGWGDLADRAASPLGQLCTPIPKSCPGTSPGRDALCRSTRTMTAPWTRPTSVPTTTSSTSSTSLSMMAPTASGAAGAVWWVHLGTARPPHHGCPHPAV